jgi:NitT/TauT family transport system ATP-binding protein
MLAPVPVAAALGLGGGGVPLSAISVLSMNGNLIGVSLELEARLRDAGHDFAFNDAQSAGQALIKVTKEPLRVGVPFPFSMHAELVYYWLSALGLPSPQNLTVRTIPPPLMAEAVKCGEIDAFCVGEPWGSKAVETGVGALLLPCKAIWAFAPEKVLATRTEWAKAEPLARDKLIRAVWRAGKWLSNPQSLMLTAELLSSPPYLDLAPELVERALTGEFTINAAGDLRTTSGFVEFHHGATGFPWRSQADWISHQLATRMGLDPEHASSAARAVFRSDLYRAAMKGTNADLPSASAKLEGSLDTDSAVASAFGRLTLPRNAFFDGRVFEPHLE